MLLGFAVTQHCNLRCPHCIRDDVTTVRSLPVGLIERVTDEALVLYEDLVVSLTGGEPLVHRDFAGIVRVFAQRDVPYRFVSNGWHIRRAMPILERHPPAAVRLSLSGGSRAIHDAERGRGSFDRVLLAVGLLSSRGIPTSLSMVVDRRDVHQIESTARLADDLGCHAIHFILPQPVPGSVERDSDLPPREWTAVRDRVHALAAESGRRTAVRLDYGAPFEGEERLCQTLALERIYVDAHGRVCTCCQLSDYGANEAEVVADLNRVSLAEAHRRYVRRLRSLHHATRPDPDSTDPMDRFPCIRCARACGKTNWLREHTDSPWRHAAGPAGRLPIDPDLNPPAPTLVQLQPSS